MGELYPLFAAMLTQRPWDDIANPDLDSLRGSSSAGDGALIRGYAQRYAREITVVLDTVPREMLLLLKMSDCLRHLDRALGAPANTHVVIAHACADALLADALRRGGAVGEPPPPPAAPDADSTTRAATPPPPARSAGVLAEAAAYARVKLRLWAYDAREAWKTQRQPSRPPFAAAANGDEPRPWPQNDSEPHVAVPENVSSFARNA